jgi:hypothetical protein
MKKILIVALALIIGNAAYAQNAAVSPTPTQNEEGHQGGKHRGHRGGSPEQKAKKQTARLVQALGLNATQETKTYEATLNAINSRQAAKSAYANDKQAMREKAKSIMSDLEGQYKAIFTAEQFTTYTAKKAELKGKMKARRAEKQDDTSFDLD